MRQSAQRSSRLRYLIAAVWALVVGSLMGGSAWLLDLPSSAALLIGVLGGLGAAAYVLRFAASR